MSESSWLDRVDGWDAVDGILNEIGAFDSQGNKIQLQAIAAFLWQGMGDDGFTAEEIVSAALDGFKVESADRDGDESVFQEN